VQDVAQAGLLVSPQGAAAVLLITALQCPLALGMAASSGWRQIGGRHGGRGGGGFGWKQHHATAKEMHRLRNRSRSLLLTLEASSQQPD
jgi:hypothetical protein